MSPPRRDTGGVDLLRRVADQVEAMQQRLSEFLASMEKRLAPLDPIPAKVELMEKRIAALEAIEQRAQGAAWAGRTFLALAAGAIGWLVNHFTR